MTCFSKCRFSLVVAAVYLLIMSIGCSRAPILPESELSDSGYRAKDLLTLKGFNQNVDFDGASVVYLKGSSSSQALDESGSLKPWTLDRPPSMNEVREVVKNGEADKHLSAMGDWWLYGPGMGYAMLNLGTVLLFPPYALYLLGNAALSISGNEPVRLIDVIPENGGREVVEGVLDEVCSVPGKLNAAIAGRDFIGVPETESK
ncbi:MAG TPA: hypothetical protein PKA63_06730 [Oligoflexia bacterium]|nr:hypothetical protein [Oligoflexia bacterium]HMP48344.1 hypothetical protein [Oligoflexia bacterium]